MTLKNRPGSKPRPRFKQKGVTLFELLLVLFVAAFVAVAVATIYNRVNNTYKENVLFNDVQQLAANIRSIYGSSTNYEGLKTSVVMSAELAPDSMVSGTKKVTPFSTADDSWAVISEDPYETFTITVYNLPASVCTGMAGKGLGVATSVATGNNTSTTNVGELASGCATNGQVALTYD